MILNFCFMKAKQKMIANRINKKNIDIKPNSENRNFNLLNKCKEAKSLNKSGSLSAMFAGSQVNIFPAHICIYYHIFIDSSIGIFKQSSPK